MIFSSLLFIFAFLPIVLGVYYIIPSSWKNYFLILVSLLFFAWGGVSETIIIIISVLFNYTLGLFLNRKYKFILLWVGLFLNLGTLFYFKYLTFLISNISPLFFHTENDSVIVQVALPIGISFYTFQAISYLIDVYSSRVSIQKRIDHLALYIVLFPQLIAGPIIRYHEIKDQIFWPTEWCKSFKHDLLPKWPIRLWKPAILPSDTRIVAFTGKPDPDDVIKGVWPVKRSQFYKKIYKQLKTPKWVLENWS